VLKKNRFLLVSTFRVSACSTLVNKKAQQKFRHDISQIWQFCQLRHLNFDLEGMEFMTSYPMVFMLDTEKFSPTQR